VNATAVVSVTLWLCGGCPMGLSLCVSWIRRRRNSNLEVMQLQIRDFTQQDKNGREA
jgi:hypothetical protein